MSASFLILDGERGLGSIFGLARDPLAAAPPLVSILASRARLRALCLGRCCCCSGAAIAAACGAFGKVLTSVNALNWTVAATGEVELASPLLAPNVKLLTWLELGKSTSMMTGERWS